VIIKSVSTVRLSSQYGDGKVFGQGKGVKTICLIKVETNSNLIGYGETYAGVYAPEIIPFIANHLNETVCGIELTDPIAILKTCYIPFVSRNGIYCSVYSGFDIALWDILAQDKKVSLPTLLRSYFIPEYSAKISKKKEGIKTYYSGGSAVMTPSEIVADVEQASSKGYAAFKMRVGVQTIDKDIERIEAARLSMPRGDLMVDAIMGTINPPWQLNQAIEFVNLCDRFNLTWIEEPLSPANLQEMSELTTKSDIPIAAGEALTGELELSAYVYQHAADILQLDVTHCGGISIAWNAAEKASEKGMTLAMHVWGSACAQKANAAFAFSHPSVEWFEYPSVELEINQSMTFHPLAFEQGYCLEHSFSGLDISINEDLINKYKFVPQSGYRIPK
jgi:L-alanine-DL-glutamate epimerase-like enolase superfamily enzyme